MWLSCARSQSCKAATSLATWRFDPISCRPPVVLLAKELSAAAAPASVPLPVLQHACLPHTPRAMTQNLVRLAKVGAGIDNLQAHVRFDCTSLWRPGALHHTSIPNSLPLLLHSHNVPSMDIAAACDRAQCWVVQPPCAHSPQHGYCAAYSDFPRPVTAPKHCPRCLPWN